MRNRKIFVKILSLILCLLTAFFAIPSTAFAKAANEAHYVENTDSPSDNKYVYPDDSHEDELLDTVNHLNGVSEDASTWSYFYAYDSSSLINYVDIDTPSGGGEESFTYDIYDRVSGKVYSGYVSGSSTIGFENEVEYTYTESGDNTSAQIATYESTVNGSSSGLTKLRNGTTLHMSAKVVGKGIASSFVGGLAMDFYYGIKQYAYDPIRNHILQYGGVTR